MRSLPLCRPFPLALRVKLSDFHLTARAARHITRMFLLPPTVTRVELPPRRRLFPFLPIEIIAFALALELLLRSYRFADG
jgi:hypothetical protein